MSHTSGTDLSHLEPLLFPSPREIERRTGWCDAPRVLRVDAGPHFAACEAALGPSIPIAASTGPDSWLRCSLDGSIDPKRSGQMYRLTINGTGRPPALLVASGVAGLRHGLTTLRQLFQQFGSHLPAMEITDWPALAVRGLMLDVSRDRVPTMSELFRLVDEMAVLKFNHLQLYTEHTFAYEGHEEVWGGCSPMTAEEVRRLDAACLARGITLAANQNCFGHLAEWLKKERYLPLAEIDRVDQIWKFYEWERQGPFSLCPTDPKALEFVRGLLRELLPNFSSRIVNINCDETADVGQGRSKPECDARGRGAVYMEFVEQVCASVRERGFKPMFWADIALSDEGQDMGGALGGGRGGAARIPDDVLSLAWGYEPDSRFEEWGAALKGAGKAWWSCPGTSAWRSITGRTMERRGNLDAALSASLKHDAGGMLMCQWGDGGHREQWPVALHGIADAAQAAWTGWPLSRKDGGGHAPVQRAKSLQVFSDRSLKLADWLDGLGDADLALRQIAGNPDASGKPTRLKNATMLYNDTLMPLGGGKPGLGLGEDRKVGLFEQWNMVAERLAELAMRRPVGLEPLLDDELIHTLRVAEVFVSRAILRRRNGGSPTERGHLASALREVSREHSRLWMVRSRLGGLDKSVSRYTALIEELESMGTGREVQA